MDDQDAEQIKFGAYANLSEIVRAGMRTLMEKDRARAFHLLETVRDEAEVGDHVPFNMTVYR